METSDRLSLSYVQSAQAQKHVTVNETTRALDALVQMAVESQTVTAEPATPVPGQGYILPAGKTGANWANFADHAVAVFQDNAWMDYAPIPGLTAYVIDEARHLVWDGTAWVAVSAGGSGGTQTTAPQFGINATADATNKLSVKSDAVLHSHDDVTPGSGDARHVVNKAGAGNTASVIFQSAFSGRAEFGLTGSDDFTIKVSPDGATFFDGVVINRTTGEVSFPNTVLSGGGGINNAEAATIAQAFADGLNAQLITNGGVLGGNPALTAQVVMATTTGQIQLGSAADGNVVEVYADGAALTAGTITTRLNMAKGEVQTVSGLTAGAVIVSSKGVNGASGQEDSGNVSPMPFGVQGFAGRQFFLNAFRLSSGARGKVYVAAGPVPAAVELRNGSGTAVVDSVQIDAFGLGVLTTNADAEFQVLADQPVSVAIAAGMDSTPNLFADLRIVPPLSTEIIGYGRSGFVSALYANTTVNWYRRTGASGSFTVSPGVPVSLDSPSTTGADNSDYEADGCLILRATGPISAFSGADSAGFEATPFYPLSALSQRIPLPLASTLTGDGGDNGFALASPCAGTAIIYNQDGSLYATVPLTRGNAINISTDQLFPCAALVSPLAGEGAVQMTTPFLGGYVEADVPIYVVQNSFDNQTQLSGIPTAGDEIAWPGITPDDIRMVAVRDQAGLLRRRIIDATGAESWVLC